jgi:hypothetical protein
LLLAVVVVSALLGGCARRSLRLPETQVLVVEQISGDPVPGVEVEVVLDSAGRKEGRTLIRAETDESGLVTVPAQTLERIRSISWQFRWGAEPTRFELVLDAPPAAFPGKENSHVFKIAAPREGYIIDGHRRGDCSNLFTVENSLEGIRIVLEQPASYLDCEKPGIRHAEVLKIGEREINARDYDAFTPEDARRLGERVAEGMASLPGHVPLDAPEVVEYVTSLVERLVRASDDPQASFDVVVIDTAAADLVALPSRRIYVYRGLLAEVESEAELAGLLAGRIGAVLARQGTEAFSAALAGVESLLRRGKLKPEILEYPARFRGAVAEAGLGGARYGLLGWDASWRAEADLLGVQYCWKAGLAPGGLAEYYERRRSTPAGERAPAFDPLLQGDESLEELARWARQAAAYFLIPRSDLLESSDEFLRMKAALSKLPPAPGDPAALVAALGELMDEQQLTLQLEELRRITNERPGLPW